MKAPCQSFRDRLSILLAALCILSVGCTSAEEKARSEAKDSGSSRRLTVETVEQRPEPIELSQRAEPNRAESRQVETDLPTQNQKGVSGFYARIDNSILVTNFDMSTTMKSGARGLWLRPDGRFARTATGVTQDFDAYCEKYKKNCGRYQIANGKYTSQLNRPQSEAETRPLSQQGDRLKIGKLNYQYIRPLNDYRLNGSYRRLASKLSPTVTHFSRDGRFKITSENSATGEPTVKSGKYRIDDYTLTLAFSNGEVETRAFYFLENAPFIDGDWYEPAK